jgi:hypothetical protein
VEELEGVEGLTQWLRERLISGAEQLKTWGTAPGTKRVANLWTELVDGEISLEDARPPKRTVHVASVKIRNESGLYLVESHQVFFDAHSLSPLLNPCGFFVSCCQDQSQVWITKWRCPRKKLM